MQQIHRSTRRSCEMFNFNSATPKAFNKTLPNRSVFFDGESVGSRFVRNPKMDWVSLHIRSEESNKNNSRVATSSCPKNLRNNIRPMTLGTKISMFQRQMDPWNKELDFSNVVPKMSIWFDSWFPWISSTHEIIHIHLGFRPWQLWRCTTWRQRCFTTNNCNQWFDRVNRSTPIRRSVWSVGCLTFQNSGCFFFLPKHQLRMVWVEETKNSQQIYEKIFSYFAALNDLDHKW